jgi:hypothetical protein
MVNRAGRLVAAAWRVALLPPAAFVVHQLRYQLAFGSGTSVELRRSGHSYLHSVAPWLVLAIALAVGCLLKALGDAFRGQTSARRFTVSFTGLWAGCVAALLAIFVCQELLEGLLLTGHPAGVRGLFGYGGWWAIPVAACVGLVLAAVFHGARWAVEEISRRRRPAARAWSGPPLTMPSLPDAVLATVAPLLRGWSERGPPVSLTV